jgi:signal transduction histidine kinase
MDDLTSSSSVEQELCESFQKSMQLESVWLFLPNNVGELILTTQVSEDHVDSLVKTPLSIRGDLYKYFENHREPVDCFTLQHALLNAYISPTEKQFLNSQCIRLWVPFSMRNNLFGLYVLGSKRGSETFSGADLEILQVITQLANMAIQHTQLIDELHQRAIESEQLHEQIVQSREAERKRVARELHDQIIQALVGLNYQLAEIGTKSCTDMPSHLIDLQTNVRQMLSEVRQICSNLRPPAFDTLGLVPAIHSRLFDLERQTDLEVVFELDGDEQQELPEYLSLCVYRVMQEALVNVQKHAFARKITIKLSICPDELCLIVQDDGKGFQVPQQLGQLMKAHHFGLVGLRERLESVKGVLTVTSIPGKGTQIFARVPLPAKANSSKKQEELVLKH